MSARCNRLTAGLFALFLATSSPSVSAAELPDPAVRELDSFVEQLRTAQKIPGVVVGIWRGDAVWTHAWGLADVENGVAMSADASFRTASINKPMTAAAILRLAELGKISLDADVRTYVPAFSEKGRITIRELLGHLGGITHYRNEAVELHERNPKSTAEAVAAIGGFDLVAKPGEKYLYSSYGYVLLAAVIEAASGKPYDAAMRELVWGPAGMTSTRVDDSRTIVSHRVRGYTLSGGAMQNSEYVDLSSRKGAGSVRSTVGDLLRFSQALDAGTLLEAGTVDTMWTAMTVGDGIATGYGMGWEIAPVSGRLRVFHTGSQQETRTILVVVPDEDFAIAVAANLEEADLLPIVNRAVLVLSGQTWNSSAATSDPVDNAIVSALFTTSNLGLATSGRKGAPKGSEVARAFEYFNDAISRERLSRVSMPDRKILAGRQPLTGPAFEIVGATMARTLAAHGKDLEVYRRELPFTFFSDYIALGGAVEKNCRVRGDVAPKVGTWAVDWKRTWNDETKRLVIDEATDLTALERSLRPLLEGSSVRPSFAPALVAYAQRRAQQGSLADAQRASALALDLYPADHGANGLAGVLAFVGGDPSRGEALLRRSRELNAGGYTAPANLVPIARFLARNDATRKAAVALLEFCEAADRSNSEVAKALAEVRAALR